MGATRTFRTLALVGFIAGAAACPADTGITGEKEYSFMEGISRGLANSFCGVIEVPRNMMYYSYEYPIVGILPGAIEGLGMGLFRTFGGIVDLLTVGALPPGHTMYDLMVEPLYPWDSPWLPPDESYQWPPADATPISENITPGTIQ